MDINSTEAVMPHVITALTLIGVHLLGSAICLATAIGLLIDLALDIISHVFIEYGDQLARFTLILAGVNLAMRGFHELFRYTMPAYHKSKPADELEYALNNCWLVIKYILMAQSIVMSVAMFIIYLRTYNELAFQHFATQSSMANISSTLHFQPCLNASDGRLSAFQLQAQRDLSVLKAMLSHAHEAQMGFEGALLNRKRFFGLSFGRGA